MLNMLFMLFMFLGDVIFSSLLINVLFMFWSRMSMLIHWNCMYFIVDMYNMCMLNFYNYVYLYYVIILWFIMFNLGSIILFYEISFLNVFILAIMLVTMFLTYLFHFLCGFYFYMFAHLLCGDEFMDVLIIRFLLCCLECFSLLCSCCALFLRLFCNLLASHFLLTLFLDFMYFFLCFLWFLNLWYFSNIISVLIFAMALFMILMFYSFLIMLDTFSAMLQLYILISMLHLCMSDWCILKHV